jgi:hypothetical protein
VLETNLIYLKGEAIMSALKSNSAQTFQLNTTFINLVTAMQLEKPIYLAKVKYKTEVELLVRILTEAKFSRGKAINEFCWITKDRVAKLEDADYATYPYPKTDKWILMDLFKLLTKKNVIELEQPLEKLNSLLWDKLKYDDIVPLNTTEEIMLLKEIIKTLKSKSFANPVIAEILKSINYWMKDWKLINHLGINDLPTLISALKEFIKYLNR